MSNNVLRLSQLRIEYNAELRQLERMVERAMQSDQPITGPEILAKSEKVNELLGRLLAENEEGRFGIRRP